MDGALHHPAQKIGLITLIVVLVGVSGLLVWAKISQEKGKTQTQVTTDSQETADSNPTESSAAAAPIFTNIAQNEVSGGSLWLFAVEDGSGQLAVSTEQNNSIKMGRLDPANPTASVSWKTVATASDTGGKGIAEHWHIFAHEYHWIVFSVQSADRSFLMKLDKDFNRLALTPVSTNEKVGTSELAALGISISNDGFEEDAKPISTNDMFLVSDPRGVAVGHMIPGVGSKIYVFDLAPSLVETTIIGGDEYQHSNGASAEPIAGGWLLYAPKSLNVVEQGPLKQITVTEDWRASSVINLLDEDTKHMAMATSVQLDTGYRVITLREVSDTYPRGQLPPPADPSQPLANDGGAIVRYVFTNNGTLVSREVLADGTDGNRPHTTLVGDKLITTWDTTNKLYIRVDTVQ